MKKENLPPILLWIACLLLGVSLLTSCGRKGPPLPPEDPPKKEGTAPETQPEEEKEKPPAPQVFDPRQY